ncbi:MAG: DUF4390 domain-containing protein [Wenzhouxiangella sp.]
MNRPGLRATTSRQGANGCLAKRAWTVFIIALCAACSPGPSADWTIDLTSPELTVADDGELVIRAGVDWQPSPAVVEALEHGVAVPVRVTVRAHRQIGPLRWLDRDRNHRFEVRYLPLLRRYELLETRTGEQQHFPRLGMMLDNLARPRDWPSGLTVNELSDRRWTIEAQALLDRSRLPPPMRMPVWFDSDWRAWSEPARWEPTSEGFDEP